MSKQIPRLAESATREVEEKNFLSVLSALLIIGVSAIFCFGILAVACNVYVINKTISEFPERNRDFKVNDVSEVNYQCDIRRANWIDCSSTHCSTNLKD